MLAMTAIVVFSDQGALLGPMLVCMFGGLSWSHIKAREWRKPIFNSANLGLAGLASAAVFGRARAVGYAHPGAAAHPRDPGDVRVRRREPRAADGVAEALDERVAVDVATRSARRLLQMYPFALMGVFLGALYLDYGAVVVPLLVVPILVARQTFASYLALKESQEAAVRTLIGALEAKDPYTAGHAERVANYAEYIGEELGMSPAAARAPALRGPDARRRQARRAEPPSEQEGQAHGGGVRAGAAARRGLGRDPHPHRLPGAGGAPSATSEAAEFAPVADDRGQPIEPHIVAVADAFDAMTSTRSYRRALPQETAFDELRKNSGKQFHPRVVEALIIAIEARQEEHGLGHEEVVHHVDAPEAGTGSAGLGDLLPEIEIAPGTAAGR